MEYKLCASLPSPPALKSVTKGKAVVCTDICAIGSLAGLLEHKMSPSLEQRLGATEWGSGTGSELK